MHATRGGIAGALVVLWAGSLGACAHVPSEPAEEPVSCESAHERETDADCWPPSREMSGGRRTYVPGMVSAVDARVARGGLHDLLAMPTLRRDEGSLTEG